MEENKPVLRITSKHGYMRDSLKGGGYKGIFDKLNLFATKAPSEVDRHSRSDVKSTVANKKVKDLVTKFEYAKPSNIPVIVNKESKLGNHIKLRHDHDRNSRNVDRGLPVSTNGIQERQDILTGKSRASGTRESVSEDGEASNTVKAINLRCAVDNDIAEYNHSVRTRKPLYERTSSTSVASQRCSKSSDKNSKKKIDSTKVVVKNSNFGDPLSTKKTLRGSQHWDLNGCERLMCFEKETGDSYGPVKKVVTLEKGSLAVNKSEDETPRSSESNSADTTRVPDEIANRNSIVILRDSCSDTSSSSEDIGAKSGVRKQRFDRKTWRSKALKKKSTDTKQLEEIIGSEKQKFLQKGIQTETTSITENGSNVDNSQKYLKIRNGNKATIRILKESSPLPSDIASGPNTILWRNLAEVLQSGAIEKLSKNELSRQEAIFEIITSQASYVNGLDVLEKYFMVKLKVRVPYVISEKQYKELFFHVKEIFPAERELLTKMMELFESDIMMDGLSDLIGNHFVENRELYLKYGRHQDVVLQHYRQLCIDNATFQLVIKRLNNSKEAGFLPFDSFLNLPMQRVTKVPLLLKTVLAQTPRSSLLHASWIDSLATVEKVAQNVNVEAGKMRHWEEMLKLGAELNMPDQLTRLPLIQVSRHIVLRAWCRKATGKKSKLNFILFNDFFVVARKVVNQSNSKPLEVCDFASRRTLNIKPPLKPLTSQAEITAAIEFQFHSDMYEREMTLLISFDNPSDNTKWLKTLSKEEPEPLTRELKSSEVDLKDVDCRVVITKNYDSKSPDELSLTVGDIIIVFFHENDGWCLGEKIVDGSRGWFRISNAQKIDSIADEQLLEVTDEIIQPHLEEAIVELCDFAACAESEA